MLAELDETGENKTKYEYIDGTNVVRTNVLPNGSKLAYGHAADDTVTAITQSTEEGEENSNQTCYTCGQVTEVRSGNNAAQYTYDYKRRLTKVDLNGTADYVKYEYTENTTESGISQTVDKVVMTNAKGETFTNVMDKRGNVLKTSYNGTSQAVYGYDAGGKLISSTDNVSGSAILRRYDSLDRITDYVEQKTATNASIIRETYTYNTTGELSTKKIEGEALQTYTYTYKNNSARELDYFTVGDIKVSPKSDCLGRNTGKEIWISNNKRAEEIITYRKVGDHATQMPSTVRYGDLSNGIYGIRDSLKYTYDEMGNISKVYENGALSVRYTYDKLNRLIREDNKSINKTYLFDYDNNGNILNKRELSFTLKTKEEAEELSSTLKQYTYKGDQLLSYGGEAFVYDNIGNPTTYRGKTMGWSKGRQLTTYDDVSFMYDGLGRRIGKQKWGTTMIMFTYDRSGNLVKQSNGLEFVYDNTGVIGLKYNNNNYIYRKDILGNIIQILDSNGKCVVKYVYTAWGNHSVLNPDGTENKSSTFLGNINPFRYRGYYYDTETGLYFLKTRYYDPEVSRFITIDDISYLSPDTINGLNLYAYCNNNPVMKVDALGQEAIDIIDNAVTIIQEIIFKFLEVAFSNWSNILYSEAASLTGDIIFKGGAIYRRIPNGLKDAIGAIGNTNSGLADIFSFCSKVCNAISIGILLFSCGKAIYDNFTNPNLTLDRKITDSIVDVGVNVGLYVAMGAGFKLGAFIGSFIPVPVLGTLVGALIGTAIAAGLWALTKFTPIVNWIKNGVSWFVNLFK